MKSDDRRHDSATAGQIQIDNGTDALRFLPGDGAQIQRSLDLAGASSATLTYSLSANVGLEADDTVTIFFSRDGIEANFVQVDQITLGTATGNKTVALTGPFTANAAIRLVASSLEAGENVNIDSLSVAFVNPALNTGPTLSMAVTVTTPTRSHLVTATTSSTKPGMMVC